MNDPRYDQLARQLVKHSTQVRKGDRVLVDATDVPEAIAIAIIRAVRAVGGVPFVRTHQGRVQRELLRGATAEQFSTGAELGLQEMKKMQAYIALRGSANSTELSDVPNDRMQLAMSHLRPVLDYRINHTRWVVLRWPTPGMAQQAGMSTEAFEDFYFRVCLLDYGKLLPAMRALQKLMARTDKVHITGPGTDLRFSIRGIPVILSQGRHNLPDGELFTAPVRDSVEGHVSFNAPTLYQGVAFDGIRLEFERGRVVGATANHTARLNQILDADEGARFIGEFALGVNPLIRRPMRDILFDEKIAGSFHFTPGQAYEIADNGNRSSVHWDMVCIQTKECGGGEIRFDGKLVRKDGKFVAKNLAALNPR